MKSVAEIVLERISQGAATSSAQGTITYANERLAGMAGMSRSSLLGRPLGELVRAESDRHLLGALLAGARRGSVECRVTLGRMSTSRRVLVSASPLNGEAICLFTDLTQLARRESADDHLRHFLDSLGEELDAMISPLLGSLTTLKRSGRLDGETVREIAAIEAQAHRVMQRAQDMRRSNGNTQG